MDSITISNSYILLFVGVVILFVLYLWYARIIVKNNQVNEALGDVDVQLKMRLDLIPNILTIANKFMEHEKELMTSITQLRTKSESDYDKTNNAEITDHLAVANELTDKMSQLKIAVENYPTLKSDQTMLNAMQSYNEVESQIAASRRFYNSAVSSLNTSIQIFPGTILGKVAHVSEYPFFKVEANANTAIDANSFFNQK